MPNEVTVRSSIQITSTELNWRSPFTEQFRADMTGRRAPSPGGLVVTPAGVDVDLSEISSPSLYEIANLDDPTTGNLITMGIWDGTEFYPLLEVLPGESYTGRLSRYLTTSIGAGSGTGTYDTGTYTLRLKSDYENVNAYIGIFER